MACFCEKFWLNFSMWLMVLMLFSTTPAYAQVGNVSTITNSLQGLIDIMTGKTATSFAILAVITIGYFWMTGKISITRAAIVCLGIGVIFGAPKIVSLLGAA